ncbi:MAG: Ger(x)C family spore germination protein [Ruminiclostridium sp.]|nr:Ger(x)C family spore germination protein [Ruminiclostridium sp.]
MKKITAIAAAFAVCLSLCGCMHHTELDEQAIVEAVGIDYSEGEYEVTVQYFNIEGTGGSSPIDQSKKNVINVSGKGADVSTALESASVRCGRSFMYGITTLIVLGRDVLTEDISRTLSFTESYYQSNPSVLVAASDGKAKDILSVKFKEGIVSIEKLEMLLENSEYHGMGEYVKILQLLSEQRRRDAGTALPLLKAVETETDATDDGKTVEISGGILLVNRNYVSDLTLNQMSGLQLLSEHPKNALVSADMNGEKVGVTVYNMRCDIEHEFENGKLKFNIDFHADGKYTDSQLENKNASFSGEVEKVCSIILEKRIFDALGETVIARGCDPCGLKYVISSEDYGEWLGIEDNFSELLQNAVFEIECDIDIDRFGIAH